MQQKTQFIATILHEPELLIFDEPFSGFDPINAELLKKEILGLKEKGATIIFSTHNMGSVEEICDNIALINNGKTVLNGEVSEIKSQFRTHIYEVIFSGENGLTKESISANVEVLELIKAGGQTKLTFKNNAETTSNELLSNFFKLGDIRSFNEKIPSMHEIFIQVVNQSNTNNE